MTDDKTETEGNSTDIFSSLLRSLQISESKKIIKDSKREMRMETTYRTHRLHIGEICIINY